MFDKSRLEFFKKLIDAPGPSGHEEIPRKIWREDVRAYTHSQYTDINGSEIATVKGKSESFSFLLCGHIDHLGLMVRYIDDSGYIFFQPVGGVDPDTYVSQRVRLLGPKGMIYGVIGKVAMHIQDEEDRKKKLKIHDLWIDIGAKTKAEAEEYAPVGTVGTVGEGTIELLNGRISGRIDNRFGAFVVAEVLRRLWEKKDQLFPTVHGVAATQEETAGNRIGATTAGYRLKPSAAIAVDVNHSMDIPSADKRREGDMAMGKGPILTFGVSSNNKLSSAIENAAKAAGIPIQRDMEAGRHGTDADAFPMMRTGIPAVSIGNPLRYMHNTVEMGDLGDIEATADVLVAFLLGIREEIDYTP